MTATKEDITIWYQRAKDKESTHFIVVCDTFDYDDYPVFVSTNENAKELAKKLDNDTMKRVMEVYNMSLPLQQQLDQTRSFNY